MPTTPSGRGSPGAGRRCASRGRPITCTSYARLHHRHHKEATEAMLTKLTVWLAVLAGTLAIAACGGDEGLSEGGGSEEVTTAEAEGEASGTLKVAKIGRASCRERV